MFINDLLHICEACIRLRDNNGNQLINIDDLCAILTNKTNHIKDYAFFVFDNDTKLISGEDEITIYAGIQLLLRFDPQYPRYSSDIAKMLGISEDFIYPISQRWDEAIFSLARWSKWPENCYSSEGVIANFNFQKALDWAIERKKLEYALFYADTEGVLSRTDVEKVTRHLCAMAKPFFNTPRGQEKLDEIIQQVLY